MNQIIDGKSVYVVTFDAMPEMPITGLTEEERIYQTALSFARGYNHVSFDPMFPRTGQYAEALNDAFRKGIITEPGTYGVHIVAGENRYEIHNVTPSTT